MTEPTNTDKARYVAERLGLCWHIRPLQDWDTPNMYYDPSCSKCGVNTDRVSNPTFLDPAGRIQLLELMMRREDWPRFAQYICSIPYDFVFTPQTIELASCKWAIPTRHITETGLLLDAAYRFLKEKEKDNEI
jgi:hypothetical protein